MLELREAIERAVDPEDAPPDLPHRFEKVRVPVELAEEIVALAELQARAVRAAGRVLGGVREAGLLAQPAEGGR